MRASGSKSSLFLICQYWARDDVDIPPEETSAAAAFGRAGHELAQAAIDKTPLTLETAAAKHGLSDPERERLRRAFAHCAEWIRKNRKVGWMSERAYAWDPRLDTARDLPTPGGHRDYSKAHPWEIPTTTDIATMRGDGAAVYDFKFGSRRNVDPASVNDQVATQGLAVSRAYGVDWVSVVLVFVSEDGVELDEYNLYAMDLQLHAHALRKAYLATEHAKPRPGKHCRELYCPARDVCPTTTMAIAEVLPAASLVRKRLFTSPLAGPEDAEEAAAEVSAIDAIEDFLERRKGMLRRLADTLGGIPGAAGHGIPGTAGHVWRKVVDKTESPDLSVRGAVDALRELGLGEAIDVAPSVTWKALKKVGGKDGEAKARAALQALGAIAEGKRISYDWRKTG